MTTAGFDSYRWPSLNRFRFVMPFFASFVISHFLPSLVFAEKPTMGARPSSQSLRPAATPQVGVTFEMGKLRIGNRVVNVELADTPERRERGLMFRTELRDDHGMLFIFEREQPLAFWMLNTLIPLSIGYFDDRRILFEVLEMEPHPMGVAKPKTYPSRKPARYALEMPRGWYRRNGIKPGAKFELVSPKR